MAKLIHQPFNEWMSLEEPLTPEQSRLLQEHLQSCQVCRQDQFAWVAVQHLFRTSGEESPAPGFTSRWQLRLATHRLRRQRHNSWIVFFVTAAISLLLLTLLGWQILQIFSSPMNLILALVYNLARLFTFYIDVSEFLNGLLGVLPSISLVELVFFTGFISLLSVLWVVAYQKLTISRRFTE